MTEPYDVAAQLTLLATWIDGLLADETADRQTIAEQASARIKGLAAAAADSEAQARRVLDEAIAAYGENLRAEILAASPEDAVKAGVAELAESRQDTLRQAFADAIAYRMARFADRDGCADCADCATQCARHQGERDMALLYGDLAAAFGIDPDAPAEDDL